MTVDDVMAWTALFLGRDWQYGPNPKAKHPEEFSRGLVIRQKGEFPHGEWVADVGSPNCPCRKANARLIAAAPALLRYVAIAAIRDKKAAELLLEIAKAKPWNEG